MARNRPIMQVPEQLLRTAASLSVIDSKRLLRVNDQGEPTLFDLSPRAFKQKEILRIILETPGLTVHEVNLRTAKPLKYDVATHESLETLQRKGWAKRLPVEIRRGRIPVRWYPSDVAIAFLQEQQLHEIIPLQRPTDAIDLASEVGIE